MEAFSGLDAIVESFNPTAAVFQSTYFYIEASSINISAFKAQCHFLHAFNSHSHLKCISGSLIQIRTGKILTAAVAAGVQHIISPDFSSDTFNSHASELYIFEPKLKAQKELEAFAAEGKLTWTAIIPGAFFDWGISRGVFWINAKNHTITIFGSGNQKVSMSTIAIVGRATVEVLRDIERFKNRQAYFAEYTISTNDLERVVKEVAGSTKWTTVHMPLNGFFDEAKRLWDEDTKIGVVDRLNSTAYPMLGTYALFDEGNRYSANFEDKNEPGWTKTIDELKEELKVVLSGA